MSVLLRKQYSTIKKEKLSEQAKSVLKSMYETTNGFKDAKATRKIKPKFEAFYNKLKESKPEAIVGGKAKSKAAPKKSADDFKAARDRRKKQTGVPKDKSAVEKDAVRPAISKRGKRTSKAGNTYYEYRDNRLDKNPSKYPMLEKGGYMAKGGEISHEYYITYVSTKSGFDLYSTNGDENEDIFMGNYSKLEEAKKIAENKGLERLPMYMRMAKGGETKVPNTYIPNRDVQELMVVLKEKSIKLKGSDILDGVYAKNSALGAKPRVSRRSKDSKSSSNAQGVYDAIVEKSKKYTGVETKDLDIVKTSDIQSLLDVGYNEKEILAIYLGADAFVEIKSDTEFAGTYYPDGIFSLNKESIDEQLNRFISAAKNKQYELGLKYPNFNWKAIIKKYDIKNEPVLVERKRNWGDNEEVVNTYEVFVGEKVVLGHQIKTTYYKNGKVDRVYDDSETAIKNYNNINKYQKDRDYKAGFNGGYWGVVSSQKEVIETITKDILSQKGGYVKDLEMFVNRLGGVGYEELDASNIKYEQGGYMAKGGGFNQYGEPYGFEEESDSIYEIHHKPEMNANNPYLIWDKIDGVYIAEFPNNQRALHFIENKKYGYADGGMMSHGGETHRLDSIFEDGGEIAEGNLEMAMSNVKAIEHHAMELKSILDENTSIEAWVVAKLERAETDLSDVTHYIDGLKGEEVESDTYFGRGGLTKEETLKVAEKYAEALSKSENKKVTVNTRTLEEDSFDLDMDGIEYDGGSYNIYDNGDVKNMALSEKPIVGKATYTVDEILRNQYSGWTKMAKGGELTPYIIWVSKDGEKREMFGEYKSKRAADMKMNKLWESGEYKNMGNKPKSMYEKEGFYADGGMMAKGGETNYLKKWRVKGIDMQGRMFKKEITLGRMSDKNDVMYALKRMPDTNIREVTLIEEIKENGGMMAKGGRLSRKQKQLDLNKNGKLDSQDFKMLRAGRKNARKK